MAYIWYFSVYFGSDKKAAEQFKDSFDTTKFVLPSNKECNITAEFDFYHDSKKYNYSVTIIPSVLDDENQYKYLWGSGSPTDEIVPEIDFAAKVFYERLKNNSNYVAACHGVEIDPNLSVYLNDGLENLEGMVLSNSVFETLNDKTGYVKFDDNYMWVPFVTSKEN